MAKTQKVLNKNSDQLFHKIGESQVKNGVQPPMINTVLKGDGLGVPMTDVPSPNKWAPLVGIAGRFILGRAAKWATSQGLKKSMQGLTKNAAGRIINQGGKFAKPGSTGIFGKIGKGLSYLTGTSKLGRGASYAAFGLSGGLGGGSDNKSNLSQNLNKTLENANKMGDKITGALGSELRRQQYDAKGWKYDHTISGDHDGAYNKKKKEPVKKVNEIKTQPVSTTEVKPKTSSEKSTEMIYKPVIKSKKQQKKEKLENKANIALAKGNYNRANRLNKRANRVSPNVVDLDMGGEYSANLSGMSTVKEKVSNAVNTVGNTVSNAVNSVSNAIKPSNTNTGDKGPDFNQPGYKQPPGTKSAVNEELNELDLKGSPFKRKGCGPRGLGSQYK